MELNKIYNMDCLEGMKMLDDTSIDMILADLPYQITACSWDSIIPLEPLWKQYKRVIKDNGAIVLTASQPFTTKLINSNMDWFKYDLVWSKHQVTGFLQAKKRPLREHEDVLLFYKKQPTYNPKMRKGKMQLKNTGGSAKIYGGGCSNPHYSDKYYPKSILNFPLRRFKNGHPTQKSVDLFEYLIKTYTNKNEIVLDNVIGSGTTAVACLKTDRKFIGFEQEEKYYNIALKRIGKFNKKYYEQLPEKEKPAKLQLF